VETVVRDDRKLAESTPKVVLLFLWNGFPQRFEVFDDYTVGYADFHVVWHLDNDDLETYGPNVFTPQLTAESCDCLDVSDSMLIEIHRQKSQTLNGSLVHWS